MATKILLGFTGLMHFGFMYLEMYLWTKPAGLRIFRQSAAQAEASRVLAANQGLYNGVLGAGLFCSIFVQPDEWAFQARMFFLVSVVVVGVYGAFTVNRRIFWIQAFPAVLGLTALYFRI